MFKNYFKISFRNMARNKLQSFFNVFGLAIGIACCILITMHVRYQLGYDRHIPDLDNIYRVTINSGGPYTPARLVKQMRADYPEIVSGTRVNGTFEAVVKVGDEYIIQPNCIIADSTFFEVFPATFLRGDAKNALNRANKVVITESVAKKIFPDQDAMGQVINADDTDYIISGIVADPPKTTTIPYQVIVPIPWEKWATVGWWTGNNFYSYLKLAPQADPRQLEAKFPDFVERYIGPEILQHYSQYESFDEYLADGKNHSFNLVPMSEIHLHYPRLSLGQGTNFQYLVIFSSVAVFILIIACINYINMSTAKSSLRAKEIGMRKVLGSVKGLIAQQFLLESFLIAGLSIVLGIVLAILLIPYFNNISQISYGVSDLLTLENLFWFLGIWLVVGLLAGVYPASYLASFKPIAALRGESVQGGSGKLRSGLVVLQFAISLFLMIGTFIVYQQLQHMSNRQLGVDADQVYVVSGAKKLGKQFGAFKNLLESNSNISEVGASNTYPSHFMADWNYQTVGDNPTTFGPLNIFVDAHIKDVWGLTIREGRFFDENLVTDTASIVVNQTLVDYLGWDEPIGQVLSRGDEGSFKVIGVVGNFVTRSAKRGDYPIVLRNADIETMYGGGYASIKIKGNVAEALSHIESTWDQLLLGYPIEGQFMDDSFQRLYDSEKRFGMLFTGFSILAILIACMGLFSLAAFVLERKRKEIALRKVMGAAIGQIFFGVSRYFLRLILIASLFAVPAAYYLGQQWLEDYVDRIAIDVGLIAIPLVLMALVSLLTISYQTYQSATSNPVDALKEE